MQENDRGRKVAGACEWQRADTQLESCYVFICLCLLIHKTETMVWMEKERFEIMAVQEGWMKFDKSVLWLFENIVRMKNSKTTKMVCDGEILGKPSAWMPTKEETWSLNQKW